MTLCTNQDNAARFLRQATGRQLLHLIRHKYLLLLLLFLLTLGETLCNSIWLSNPPFNNIYITSLIYFACGMGISILSLFRADSPIITPVVPKYGYAINISFALVFFIVLASYTIYHAHRQFQSIPLDYKIADMLPIIKIMCSRWLNGEQVYAPIPEIWGGIRPIYLPCMWMPFIPAEYFGFDLRWINVIFILGGILAIMSIMNLRRMHPLPLAIAVLPLFLLLQAMFRHNVMSITEEGVVYGYYLLLGYALARSKYALIAVAIAICLFSRYALVFWVPAYLAFTYLFGSKRNALTMLLIVGILTLLIFIIPFFDRIGFFMSLHDDYIEGAKRLWQYEPEHVMRSLGLAKFFSIHQIPLIHALLISFAVIVPSAFFAAYALLRKKCNINPQFYGLCSLKLSLVFFYNWLENPYLYLFFTSSLFSYCILCKYAEYPGHPAPAANQ